MDCYAQLRTAGSASVESGAVLDGGTIHDYVPFYFGTLTPMLLNLKTGRVPGYQDGQAPLIHLVTTAQQVAEIELGFAFTDGHAYAAYSRWFDDLSRLDEIDWQAVHTRYWGSHNDPTGELQRKKQAEFLVHKFVPWHLIQEIVVIDDARRLQVARVLQQYGTETPVSIRRSWYF